MVKNFYDRDYFVLDIEKHIFLFEDDVLEQLEYNEDHGLFVFQYSSTLLYKKAIKKLGNISSPEERINKTNLFWLNKLDPNLKKYIVTYVFLKFEDKDEFKILGGKWDKYGQSWYYIGDQEMKINNFIKEQEKDWTIEYNSCFSNKLEKIAYK